MSILWLINEIRYAIFDANYDTLIDLTGWSMAGWSGFGVKLFIIIIGFPVYVFFGFVGGAILAFLYNLVVRRFEELTEVKKWFFSSPLKTRSLQILLMLLWCGYSFFLIWYFAMG